MVVVGGVFPTVWVLGAMGRFSFWRGLNYHVSRMLQNEEVKTTKSPADKQLSCVGLTSLEAATTAWFLLVSPGTPSFPGKQVCLL